MIDRLAKGLRGAFPTHGVSLNKVVEEYALRHLKGPIGVAQWETSIVKALPKEFVGILPTVEKIEAELAEQARIGPQSRRRKS